MAKVLVLYYSSYGHMEQMANAAAEGARAGGAQVVVKRVPELMSEDAARKAGMRWEQPAPWLPGRVELAVGSLFLSSAARRVLPRGPPRPRSSAQASVCSAAGWTPASPHAMLRGQFQRGGADAGRSGVAVGSGGGRRPQSPNIFCLSSRRCWASRDSVAVGRAISRPNPIGSPVSSQKP